MTLMISIYKQQPKVAETHAIINSASEMFGYSCLAHPSAGGMHRSSQPDRVESGERFHQGLESLYRRIIAHSYE